MNCRFNGALSTQGKSTCGVGRYALWLVYVALLSSLRFAGATYQWRATRKDLAETPPPGIRLGWPASHRRDATR